MTLGSFDLFVAEKDFEAANAHLKYVPPVEGDEIVLSSGAYFKRAFIFSICAIVFLPVIFNIVAIRYIKLFWSAEKNTATRIIGATILIGLQFSIVFWLLAVREVLGGSI